MRQVVTLLLLGLGRGWDRQAIGVEVGQDLLADLHRGVSDAAPESMALQDAAVHVRVIQYDAAIGAAVLAFGEAAVRRLAQHEGEVRPVALTI